MAKYHNEDRRKALCEWLTANGIDPSDVPIDSDLTIATEPDDTRVIRYEAFVLSADGNKILDERRLGPAIEKRTAHLDVEPPEWWEPYEKPTREQLASELEQARGAIQHVQENLVRELHRRQTRYDTGPEMSAETRVNVAGELIGLRVALGIALGHPAKGADGIIAAAVHYDTWLTQRTASRSRRPLPLCDTTDLPPQEFPHPTDLTR